jgi:glycosyltransferase involved in cell wall biosynthesis
MSAPVRIGVYQDGPFRRAETGDGMRVAPDPVDAPFVSFFCEVAQRFDAALVFARLSATGDGDPRVVLPGFLEVVALPDYGSLRRLAAVARSVVGTAAAFWRGLDRVDVVWAFGPHPLQLVLVALAAARGKRVAIGVRQDTRAYFRARLPSARWKPVLIAVDAMDLLHRLLARRVAATVVGGENARRYASGRGALLPMAPSLVRASEVVNAPPERDWLQPIELLAVGRIDAEKNPVLLVEAVAALERARPGRYRLSWAGVGPLEPEVRRRAAQLGVQDRIELLGYVPFGPALLAYYRRAHVFVHVSLTEGVPQVLVEALASGTPVVATDVGGVAAALDGGGAGVLVPPADLPALVGAVIRVSDDEPLRRRIVDRGLELARERTIEAEAARVAAFLREHARPFVGRRTVD